MKTILSVASIMFIFSFAPSLYAKKSKGVFTVVKGKVEILRSGKKKARKARVGTKVFAKDTIIAAKNSRAKVIMVDKNILNISPESKLELATYEFDKGKNKKKVILNLMYGKVRSTVKQKYDGKKNLYRVKTPSAVAGVRGTDFFVGHNLNTSQSQVVTFEGQVAFGNGIGASGTILNAVKVNPGQITQVTGNSAPPTPTKVPKTELVNMDSNSNAEVAQDRPSSQNDGGPREPANKNNDDSGEKGESQNQPDSNTENNPKNENSQADSESKNNGSSDQRKGPRNSDTASESGTQNNRGSSGGSNPQNFEPSGTKIEGNDRDPASAGTGGILPPPPPAGFEDFGPDFGGANAPYLPPDFAGEFNEGLPDDFLRDQIQNSSTVIIEITD
ncbi:MAG: FecR domain-containing protein [Bdellovibrionales bacterium]